MAGRHAGTLAPQDASVHEEFHAGVLLKTGLPGKHRADQGFGWSPQRESESNPRPAHYAARRAPIHRRHRSPTLRRQGRHGSGDLEAYAQPPAYPRLINTMCGLRSRTRSWLVA
jgi:hypothetical protein